MSVAFDEPRHRKPAVELDDFGIRADVSGNLIVAANRGDPVPVDRQRFDVADFGVHRRNRAAAQHEVRR